MRISSSSKNTPTAAPTPPAVPPPVAAASPAPAPQPQAPAAPPSKEVVLTQSPTAPPTPGGTTTRSTLLSQLREDMAASLKRHDAPVLKDAGADAKAPPPPAPPVPPPGGAGADDRLAALERAVSELAARLPVAQTAAVPAAAEALPGELTAPEPA